ncbi:MAG: response regulator [Gammaproteobacteria bacterium]|nr:response regulator [Gammaproteobacteria bacterium]
MPKILIVDDSATQRQALINILNKHNFETIIAEDGQQGVDLSRSEMPDLILMDVVMPGLNGFQATRHISKHETTKDIPIIILTSKDQETDRVWAQRQGAKDYILKPASETDLMTKINLLLN